MNSRKKDGENDWELMKRVAPEIYSALHRIPGSGKAYEILFESGTQYWDGDNEIDLTNKVMMGCIYLQIEALQDILNEIEYKYNIVEENENEWHEILKEQDQIVFMNGTGTITKMPYQIYSLIEKNIPIDVKIKDEGNLIHFEKRNEIVATIPKSLLLKIKNGHFIDIPEEVEP